MTEQERPPTSGPGSGAVAWRDYAAAVTGSPAEKWAEMSREEIIALLDAEGDELSTFLATDATPAEQPPDAAPDEAPDEAGEPEAQPEPPVRRRGPVWMVPTADGMVPEHELRRR